MKKLAIVFCPPLKEYPEPPSDHSIGKLIDCPLCQDKMWLSIKKEIMKETFKKMNHTIFLACYRCFANQAQEWVKTGVLSKENEIWELHV